VPDLYCHVPSGFCFDLLLSNEPHTALHPTCVNTRQEKQFDTHKAFSQACLTSAFGDIEGKTPRVILPGFGSVRSSKRFSHMIKSRYKSPYWSAGSGQWALIDHNQTPDMLHAADDLASVRDDHRLFQILRIRLLNRELS
jgi:hypothetical protein